MGIRPIHRMAFFTSVLVCPLLVAETAYGEGSKIERITVTGDLGEGIVAVVELIPPAHNAGRDYVGTTDDKGILVLAPPLECPQRYRLYFRVEAGRYLSKTEDCQRVSSPLATKLSSFIVVDALAQTFEPKTNDTTNAARNALVASELAFRLQTIPSEALRDQLTAAREQGFPGTADALEKEIAARMAMNPSMQPADWSSLAYESAGVALGVEEPIQFDTNQRRFVMSEDLSRAVASFQASRGIKKTGILDYKTLSTLSESDIGGFLHTPEIRATFPMR